MTRLHSAVLRLTSSLAPWSCLLALAACSSAGSEPPVDLPLDPLIAARPYGVTLPEGHDRSTQWPLIVVLHGRTVNGLLQDRYFRISAQATSRRTVVAYPDGLMDSEGVSFWNATDACCDRDGIGVDDVAYLTALIGDARARYAIDPKRVFLVGHSNGAFMAHRMACDRSELIAGIAALAGVTWKDPSRCTPTHPVAVAQIHGDADTSVLFEGGPMTAAHAAYPSAMESFAFWSDKGGCSGSMSVDPLDLESGLPGAETTRERATSCAAGGAAELWRIVDGGHIPLLTPTFTDAVYDFFEAHPRL